MSSQRVVSAYVERPGRAAQIAANGWTCRHDNCGAPVTCEVVFWESARGPSGVRRCSHGVCDAHAEAHAISLFPEVSR